MALPFPIDGAVCNIPLLSTLDELNDRDGLMDRWIKKQTK